jgi:serine/threonine protein kinase
MFRLDKDLWRTLSPLLDQALDLEPQPRAALLAEIGQQRPDLSERLARLLNEHDRLLGSDFLESSLTIDDTPVPSLAGHAIGPYTLEALLGMGGMGTVWRARRSDGRFEGCVAVKLLNLSLLDRRGDARFKREGTLLARLAHPHIARLLDAGVTSTGQPYLVLEFVDGTAIDRFADERRLDPFRRLELFLQVADAVAHAHASLIVHRDLKPSNILVRADGHTKLLDFGVGALIEEESNRPSTLTIAAANALTPEYAAPEQASGDIVTTATDVYALGVLLYTLLTGRHPTGEGCRTPVDHLQALRDRDAILASDAVSAPTREDAGARAMLRQSTPERLRRLYRDDIDNVLAKALEKEPGRRYKSVTAMADDIRRFLNHEPLSVHGRAWSYRAAKFIRRHRWPVAATIIAFTMLSGGLLIANRQRLIAERRFGELRHLSQQVFELDKKIENLAGATEARQALVAASLEYLEGLARDARGDFDLLQEVADGYWRVARIQGVPIGLTLGNFAQAEESLRKADDLVETILASRPRDRRALGRSAVIGQDRMIVADSERRDADALSHARRAAARMDALLSAGAPTAGERDTALALYGNVAMAHLNMHRYDDATRYAQRQLEVARMLGPQPRSVSNALTVLANALRLQGDLDGALKAIREAREIGERATYSSETNRMFSRYPVLLREAFILGEDRAISLNRPAEAIVLLREAFEMHEAGARRDPNDFTSRARVGTTGRELGDILRWRAPQEAIAVYDVALARLAEIRDNLKARRDRALILANSSYALRRLNRTAEGRQRVEKALAILEQTKDYPSDRVALDSELRSVLHARADQRADEGHVQEAIQQYGQLLEKVMAAKPDVEHDLRDAYTLSLLYRDLAHLHRATGASADAAAVEAKSRAIWTAWNETRPNNPFVLRQIAAADEDAPDAAGVGAVAEPSRRR